MNRDSPGYVLGFMAALCLFFGTGVALVHYATRDRLAANERLNHNRILAEAFGLEVAGRTPADYERAVAGALEIATAGETPGPGRGVYRLSAPADTVYGFHFSGMGFWDRIDGFVTLDAGLETIRRVRFFDHKETPGLGARIEEPEFLDQFEGLEIAWNADPARRIVIGGGIGPERANRVDAVSGATQTSRALMEFFNEELERIRAVDPETLAFRPLTFREP